MHLARYAHIHFEDKYDWKSHEYKMKCFLYVKCIIINCVQSKVVCLVDKLR